VTGALAAASLVFTGLCAACLVYLHLAPTGYSPLADPVSAYGVGRHARWYQAQAACSGIAAALLAGSLGTPAVVVVLLALYAGARLAITQFPMDTRPVGHWLLAVVAFGGVAAAAIRLKATEHGTPTLGWAMLACLVATTVARRNPPLRRRFGLAERGFYAALLVWLVLVAARLL
jgi:hypothetical protein